MKRASVSAGDSLVTVITATLNAAKTLESCLRSVHAQNYPAIEHLVIDGGSTDDTVQILTDYAVPGTWTSEPDQGIYDAWNKGLRSAKGEWICFLGSDDILLPGAVSAYMQLARDHPEASYLSSRVRWVGLSGRTRVIGKPWSWSGFSRYMSTAHVGSMHHRSLYETFGRYDTSLKIVGDYEFLLRAGSQLSTAFLPEITAVMHAGGASDSLAAIEEATQVKMLKGLGSRGSLAFDRCIARWIFRLRSAL